MKTFVGIIIGIFLIAPFWIVFGYEYRKIEFNNVIEIVDKGDWGKDFMICSKGNMGNYFGFQVNNKIYKIMGFKTLKFLIDSEVFFDKDTRVK